MVFVGIAQQSFVIFRDMEREIYDLYIEYIESSEDIN